MNGCKPCNTPIPIHFFNDKPDNPCSNENATTYRTIFGALQYLTFSVSKLSQFMHSPTYCHLTTAKRVLRYISGTTSQGILFKKSTNSFKVNAFSNSDWTRNNFNKRSTMRFIIYLGDNPISWLPKSSPLYLKVK